MALELPNGESTRELIKCVVVGDSGVGKTKLICAQALGQGIKPERKHTLLQCAHGSHMPSVFAIDKYYKSAEIQARSNMIVDGVPVALRLWDTFGDHQKNRRFAYQNSNVVALCFAVNCPQSLESVNYFWYKEIKQFCPRAPIILVGTKSDCRDHQPPDGLSPSISFSQEIQQCSIVWPRMGRQVAQEIGGHYYECSVLSMYGLQDVFMNVIRAGLCNQRAKRLISKQLRKVLPPQLQQPYLPPCPQTPDVGVPPSTYHDDLMSMLESQWCFDIIFIVGGRQIRAHRAVLSASACKITAFLQKCGRHGVNKDSSYFDSHALFSVQQVSDDNRLITLITVFPESSVTYSALHEVLELLYSGSTTGDIFSSEFHQAAEFLGVSDIQCFITGNDAANIFAVCKASVAISMRKLLFKKELHADISFELEDNVIPAHKAILVARCEMMAAMFQEGHFEEANRQMVKLPDVSLDAFLAVLEYLYTDEISNDYRGSKVAAVAVANFFCLPRLVALYEKLIVEELELDMSNARNVIEYLVAAEMHNATQLKSWGEHYIIVHYDKIKATALNILPVKIARSLESKRWPPLWYIQENEWYEKALMKEDMLKLSKKHKWYHK